jgi:hypothetical protein
MARVWTRFFNIHMNDGLIIEVVEESDPYDGGRFHNWLRSSKQFIAVHDKNGTYYEINKTGICYIKNFDTDYGGENIGT